MAAPPRILVVDDDTDQLDLVKRLLTRAGYVVAAVDSPFGATNEARRFKPDVVLLDVDMPAIRGDKLVRLLRANAAVAGMLIVLFSSTDQDTLRSLASEAGADAWVSKTFDQVELKAALERIVRRR